MARPLDPSRRDSILEAARRLFAEKGYGTTSVATIAAECGLPVGSVYTYFSGKEAILASVIEEGWRDFEAALSEGLARSPHPEYRLVFLVREALPSLYRDLELISILLAEGSGVAKLGEKLDRLAGLVEESLPAPGRDIAVGVVRTAIAVVLLGCLDTARLYGKGALDIGPAEIEAFLVSAMEQALPGLAVPGLDPDSGGLAGHSDGRIQ